MKTLDSGTIRVGNTCAPLIEEISDPERITGMTDPLVQPDEFKEKGIAVAGENNPISVSTVAVSQQDTVGAIFLGLLAFFLFIALQLSQRRNRKLLAQLAEWKQRNSPQPESCEGCRLTLASLKGDRLK
jgi:hypothetical protein